MKSKFFLFVLLLFFMTPCFAEEELGDLPQPSTYSIVHWQYMNSWHFYLSPYFWFTGLSGHVNILGNRVFFDNDFDEIRHALDFSLGAHFEAFRGNLSLLLDSNYVKITQKPSIRTDGSKTTYETTTTDLGVYYTLYSIPSSYPTMNRASFEILGAGRIATFYTVIVSPVLSTPPAISDSSSFLVPVVGARMKYNFNPKWRLWFSADFGGFEVSHVNSTWSSALGVGYKLNDCFDVTLAYKVLSMNYSIQAITINTFLQGPVLGLGISW